MSDLIKKDLGTVSAYKYARLHGYTGTEDEFGVLMASYASVAQEASRSATDAGTKAKEAKQSAQSASQSATNAQNSADNAQQSATSAQESANSASASASRALVSAEKTQSDRQIVELTKSDVLSAVSDAQSYATTAQSVSQAIQDMNVEAVTLEPDFDATIEKIVNSETGVITLKYGIPKGAKGRITFSDDGTGNIVIQ